MGKKEVFTETKDPSTVAARDARRRAGAGRKPTPLASTSPTLPRRRILLERYVTRDAMLASISRDRLAGTVPSTMGVEGEGKVGFEVHAETPEERQRAEEGRLGAADRQASIEGAADAKRHDRRGSWGRNSYRASSAGASLAARNSPRSPASASAFASRSAGGGGHASVVSTTAPSVSDTLSGALTSPFRLLRGLVSGGKGGASGQARREAAEEKGEETLQETVALRCTATSLAVPADALARAVLAE